VLDLDVTKAVESGLITAGEHSERIEDAKRRLNTELFLEGHVEGRRGGLAGLGRGEGSGGGNKGGEDGYLHLLEFMIFSENMSNRWLAPGTTRRRDDIGTETPVGMVPPKIPTYIPILAGVVTSIFRFSSPTTMANPPKMVPL